MNRNACAKYCVLYSFTRVFHLTERGDWVTLRWKTYSSIKFKYIITKTKTEEKKKTVIYSQQESHVIYTHAEILLFELWAVD